MAYIRTLSNGKYRVEIRKKQTTIQNKTFANKSDAEQWANDFESKLETILSIKPKKLKKLSPDKVEELGGMALFQKLGVEIEFLTFNSLVNEYTRQWTGKDENMMRRANFWLNVFNVRILAMVNTDSDHREHFPCPRIGFWLFYL